MNLATHRVTLPEFVALAGGTADAATIQELIRVRRSRDLTLLHALVRTATAGRHPQAAAANAAFRTLAAIERIAPDAVAAVLHYPSVSSWTLQTVRLLDTGRHSEARPGFLAAVAGAAAARGGVAMTIDLTAAVADRVVLLPSLGRLVLGPDDQRVELRGTPAGAELISDTTRITVPRPTGGRWREVPVLSATCRNRRVEILLDTPDFAGESGPAFAPEEPFAPDLVAVWRALLRDAWRLLVDHHEHLAAEVSALVRVFAPLAAPTAGGLSATLDDAFGCIALTRPMDATSLGLTLAHEIQHAKLTAISDLFQLVEHDGDERFYAPWRDDPRPTFGMLHGVYAHLGVAGFWKRQLAHVTGAAAFHAETEFARWLDATREAVGILSVPGRLKPVGTIFLDGIATTLESWRSARVSAGARAAADRLRRAHRAAWMAAHGDSSE